MNDEPPQDKATNAAADAPPYYLTQTKLSHSLKNWALLAGMDRQRSSWSELYEAHCEALGLLAFALALIIGSAPSAALPSACNQRCFYPNTCYDECEAAIGQWTTCFDYFGGFCDPW